MWRDIWNFRGGAEIALSGDMYNSIYESVNEEVKDWDTIHNVFVKFLKMNTKELEKRVLSKDEDATKKAIKSIVSGLTNAQRSLKMESVNEGYPTDLKVGSVIMGQGFTMLKGIEGGKYYKVVEMDDYSATLVPSDKSGNVKGSSKVRHKLDSIEGGIKTAKRGDENGIVVIKESVNESISHEAMGIASMTNTRKEAVQKFIDDNNLDAKEILTHVTKGKLPERIRFVQALVGTPNNSSFKWYVKNYANESVVNEGRYDADLDKIEAVVKNATSFMNVGSELKKAGIKYDFTTSMIPMYMIKVSGNTIAICNKKYAAGAEREVKDIAIGLLN
jgi:hypothetical protein